VAVVQISRIQVRRGRKGESNIPQLASGEIGWAVDAQELYIGNGSVAEGAPQVGNTKILTAADNIFEIADQYEYKTNYSLIQTGETARTPIKVTLQERLDYDAYVADFGAVHDESIIQTSALQRAIDNLFLNTKTSSQNRFILQLGPGLYRIDDSIKIPPYTTLRGAGMDKTIIEQTTNNPIFVTVNGSSTIGNYDETTALSAENQTRYIDISGMTLRFEDQGLSTQIFNTALDLQSVYDGKFEDLKLHGYWDGDGDQASSIGINIKSFSGAVRSKNNTFKRLEIEGFAYGISSSYDIENTNITDTNFKTCLQGVRLGSGMPVVDYTDPADVADKLGQGEAYGPENTIVSDCSFREIYQQGFYVAKGNNNTSSNNKYYDVGNDGGTNATPLTSIIKFDVPNNNTIDDWFSRTSDLSYSEDFVEVNNSNSINFNSDTVDYIPEVEGIYHYTSSLMHQIDTIGTNGNWCTAFRLPAIQSSSFTVDYQYRSDEINGSRNGTLTVTIDRENDEIAVSDNFEFIGVTQSVAENLTFRGKLVTIDNIINAYVEMKNGTTSDSGTLHFTIQTRS
jgi:hypothetical protein